MSKEPVATDYFLGKLLKKEDLSQEQSYKLMKSVMNGDLTPAQIAAFLVSLRMKGETVGEIAGCALAMRDASRPLMLKDNARR